MKIVIASGIALVIFALEIHAQPATSGFGNEVTTADGYSIKERGPHHRIWERREVETTPMGTQVERKLSYTELETGMHYGDDNQWKEATEEIDILGDHALVTRTAHKLVFKAVPALDAAGTIYYCVSNSICAVSPQGQLLWSIFGGYTMPGVYLSETSPIVSDEGILYASLGSTLYAIATGTNGPADSPWPMYRQNVRHTGKIEKPALQQPKKRADANFEFQLYAQLGQTNVIQTTTNLNTWTSLTSVVVTTVPQPVVDLTASNHPARFYRSAVP